MAPIFLCPVCHKDIPASKILVCSRCKESIYCGRECQKIDWKDHKGPCKILTRQKLEQPHREYRLLKDWSENANRLLRWIVAKSLSHEQIKQQPPNHMVFLEVEFDYNYETFLPVELPPNVVHRRDCSDLTLPDFPSRQGIYWMIILINYRGVLRPFALHMSQDELDTAETRGMRLGQLESWENLHGYLKTEVGLSSRVFQTWPQLQEKNINKQLEQLRGPAFWSSFGMHALHLGSPNPLYLTHVVVVKFDFGRGLGEIQKLDRFRVTPVTDLLNDMKSSENFSSTMMKDWRNRLNLELKQQPGYATMRIVMWNSNTVQRYSFICVAESRIPLRPESARTLDIKESDEIAKVQFGFLQSVRLPSIVSPEID